MGGAGGNFAVIFFHFFAGNFGSDVAGDDDGDVVGAVVRLKPFLHVASCEAASRSFIEPMTVQE